MKNMRVVALEEHFVAPAAARQLAGLPMPPGLTDKLADVGEARIENMDAAGIDYQVLGHNIPGTQALTGQEAIDVAMETNDFLAEAVCRHPDRLGGFAVLPTSEADAAAKELQRAKDDLGFFGSMINGTTGGRFLDDASFSPILEAAEELEMPIYLHPAFPPPAVFEAYYSGFTPQISLFLAGLGWHSETAIHVLRMIFGGVFDRLPRLQLIIGHMGEGLPFWIDRIVGILRQVDTGLERPFADYFRDNIHITTSAFFSLPPLLCSMMVVGADRIMFSVDYPYCQSEEGTAFLASAEISPTDKELIAHRNAETLLGLKSVG
jgi:hypothetical protein